MKKGYKALGVHDSLGCLKDIHVKHDWFPLYHMETENATHSLIANILASITTSLFLSWLSDKESFIVYFYLLN